MSSYSIVIPRWACVGSDSVSSRNGDHCRAKCPFYLITSHGPRENTIQIRRGQCARRDMLFIHLRLKVKFHTLNFQVSHLYSNHIQGVALTSDVVQLNCTRAIGPFRLILDLLLPFCVSHTETIGASRDLLKGAMTPSGPRHMPETRR